MNIITAPAQFNPGPGGICAAIGVFDGVHLGHQSVIGQAARDAQQFSAAPVVVTFDRHPNAVVAPQNVPPLIYPLSKKLAVIASLGAEATCVIHFDKAFSQITGEDFIRSLAAGAGPVRSICVGREFQFGCKRSGNVALLESLGGELGFKVHALPDVSLEGQPVSSTRIREAIRAGQLDLAARMLGRPYSLCAAVAAGGKLGRKLGFPTANLDVAGIAIPPSGVYAADASVHHKTYRAAVNIGARPTVHSVDPVTVVEAHLLDFDDDIYGEEIELTFLNRLRDEVKFPSLDALRRQIARDIEAARNLRPTHA